MSKQFDDTTPKEVIFSGFTNTDFEAVGESNYVSSLRLLNSTTTEKVRIVESAVPFLDPEVDQEESSSDMFGLDSNQLEITFSPDDTYLESVAKYFGSFNIDDYIGDPREQERPYYRNLEFFLRNKWRVYLHHSNINDYIKLFQLYDSGLFEQLKQLCPARVDCTIGFSAGDLKLRRNKVEKIKTYGSVSTVTETAVPGPELEITLQNISGSILSEDRVKLFSEFQTKITGSLRNKVSDIYALVIGLPASVGSIPIDPELTLGLESIVTAVEQTEDTTLSHLQYEGTQLAAPGFNLPTPETLDNTSVVEYVDI